MKNHEEELFEISIGRDAQKKVGEVLGKKGPERQSSDLANIFVDRKIAGSQLVPNDPLGRNYNQVFADFKSDNDISLPPEIDDVIKFIDWHKKWVGLNNDNDNDSDNSGRYKIAA